jgi:1,4-alpha-glucan branching enzyme
MKRRNLFFVVLMLIAKSAFAQLLTVSPDFPVDNSSMSITADCSKGNQALLNYGNVNDVYVHVGVITNTSVSSSDWKYVKFTWATADAAAKATSLGNNKYQYTINNIRSFFGVPAGELIRKVAVLFRNGAGTIVQRNDDGSDMYGSIYDNTLAGSFFQPVLEPRFNPVPEPFTKSIGDNIALEYRSNKTGILKLFLNGTEIATASGNTITANPILTVAGNQQVIGRVTDGSITKSDTIQFFIAPPVTVAPLPPGVQEGINYVTGDNAVILVLYAPGKNRVITIGDFNNWLQDAAYQTNKTPDGKYFWIQINGLTPGQEYGYQYVVDGSLKIADFYAEKVLDPNRDAEIPASTYPNLKPYPTGKTTGIVSVFQTRQPTYNWKVKNFIKPDKKNLLIYELFVRDFVAARNYKTIIDTLPYLQRLGINAIELMPVNEFEGNISWGYNPSFFFAADKYYGTKNALKELIDSCHGKGIAVIMDVVLNHAFGQNPQAQLYWDAANNRPAADNPWFNAVEPHFLGFGNDFNHESAATQYFVDRVNEYWLTEYKIDGIRFDFTKGFTQKVSTSDATFSAYDASRIAILKRMNAFIKSKVPDAYVILEHLCDNTEEKELAANGMLLWGNANFNFNEATMGYHNNGKSNFSWIFPTARGYTEPLLVGYMESHDEERLMYKNLTFGNNAGTYNVRDLNTALKRMEMASAFLAAVPGPKMFWQFGELGYDKSIFMCNNGTVPVPYPKDSCKLEEKLPVWDYNSNANRKNIYKTLTRMLDLRKAYATAFTNNNVVYDVVGAVKKIQLTDAVFSLAIIGNFDVNAASGSLTFANGGKWYNLLNANDSLTLNAGATQNFTLQPGEYKIYTTKNLGTITSTNNLIINRNPFNAKLYPNPVAATSQILYELPEAGRTYMQLINAVGKQVKQVVIGNQLKGKYSVSFSRFTTGKELAQGNYLLSISSNNKSSVIKFMVL